MIQIIEEKYEEAKGLIEKIPLQTKLQLNWTENLKDGQKFRMGAVATVIKSWRNNRVLYSIDRPVTDECLFEIIEFIKSHKWKKSD